MVLLSHQPVNTFFYIPLTKCFTLYLGYTSSQLTMKGLLRFGSTLLIPLLLFAFKCNVLSAILKVYFKYDQNRDKNDKLPEKVG